MKFNLKNILDNSKQSFDKEKWAMEKKQQRDYAYEAVDNMLQLVKTDENSLQEFLQVQSKMGGYSYRNQLLIMAQYPEAKMVKDYKSWSNLGVKVEKNAKGIIILEPGDNYTREDGSQGTFYNAKKVYDIMQTEIGKKFKTESYDLKSVFSAIIETTSIKIKAIEQVDNGAHFDIQTQTIEVQKGLDIDTTLSCVIREIAQAELYKKGMTKSSIADCVAYVICQKYDIPLQQDLGPTIESFKKSSLEEVQNTLSIIRDVSFDLSSKVDKHFEQDEHSKNKIEKNLEYEER